ncbi:MAG: PepSY-associated TM helix domain-containing protein [Myxococcota bacterium]
MGGAGTPRRKLYFFHRSVGILTAFLGTVVFYTGAFTVFAPELEVWATRDLRDSRYLSLHALPADAIENGLAAATASFGATEPDAIDVGLEPNGAVVYQVEAEDNTFEVYSYDVFRERGDLRVGVSRRSLRAPGPRESLEYFFVHLHDRLLLPVNVGRPLTGLLGFALVISAITGAYVHWPKRKTVLRAPRGRIRQRLAGWHTLLGAWTLLFTILSGATGAYLCLQSVYGIPLYVAALGPDETKIRQTLDPPFSVLPAPGQAALTKLVADAHRRAGGDVPIESIRLHHWGRPNAYVFVGANDVHRKPTQMRYVYHGASGEYLGRRGRIGGKPSVASRAIQYGRALHYGNITGYSTKVPWLILGLLTCVIAGTGLSVWAHRERKSLPRLAKLADAAVGALIALPLASAVAVVAWAIAIPADPIAAMGLAFLATLFVAASFSARRSASRAFDATLLSTSLAFLLLPWVGYAVTGVRPLADRTDPIRAGAAVVDIGFLIAGGLCLLAVGARWVSRQQAPTRLSAPLSR